MKPSEVYAMPTRNERYNTLSDVSEEIVKEVFQIEALPDEATEKEGADSPLWFNEKLRWHDDYTSQSLYAVEFEQKPFAVVAYMNTEKSGSDVNFHVTDVETYGRAQAYVLSLLRRPLEENAVVDENEDLDFDFSPARVARFANGYRMVKASHVGFRTGAPVYDHTAACVEFKKFTQQKNVPVDDAAVEAFRGALGVAILSDSRVVVGKMISERKMLGGFFAAEGLTYAVTSPVNPARAFSLTETDISFIGKDTAYPLIETFWKSGRVDRGDPFYVDLQRSFGLEPEEADAVVTAVAMQDGREGKDFMTAAVDAVRSREEIPEGYSYKSMHGNYEGVVHARLLAEDAEMARFGLGHMQSVAYARKWWGTLKEKMEVEAIVRASFAPRA